MKNSHYAQKFARPRLLIIGCGDIGMRFLALMRIHFRVFAVTRHAAYCARLRTAGAVPVLADLDQPASLKRLQNLATRIVILAPPRPESLFDERIRNLVRILPEHSRLIYISTSGVYGDCQGKEIDETQPVQPATASAARRVDAELVLRHWARRSHSGLGILRVPAIYASDRLPIERLQNQMPALRPEEDVYVNHIHADDLAFIIRIALFRARPGRVYHATDCTPLYMGDYFDKVADLVNLPRPIRLPKEQFRERVSPEMMGFASASRRLSNHRLQTELGVRLLYPDTIQALVNLFR